MLQDQRLSDYLSPNPSCGFKSTRAVQTESQIVFDTKDNSAAILGWGYLWTGFDEYYQTQVQWQPSSAPLPPPLSLSRGGFSDWRMDGAGYVIRNAPILYKDCGLVDVCPKSSRLYSYMTEGTTYHQVPQRVLATTILPCSNLQMKPTNQDKPEIEGDILLQQLEELSGREITLHYIAEEDFWVDDGQFCQECKDRHEKRLAAQKRVEEIDEEHESQIIEE